MKNLILVFTIFIGGVVSSQAQNYDSAIGLRLGIPNSITYKTFVSESNAIELYGGIRSYFGNTFFNVNGAYQIHTPIETVDNLQWYYGLGAGAALGSGTTSLAINAYIGLDYRFADLPISLSIDYVPTYFLGSSDLNFQGGNGNLAIRYILGENN